MPDEQPSISDDLIDELVTTAVGNIRPVRIYPEWQPIETAPFDVPILAFGHWERWSGEPVARTVVWQRDSRNKGRGLEFYSKEINGEATHWMLLPPPPASVDTHAERHDPEEGHGPKDG